MLFHALTIARSRGCYLNTRPIGRVLKHLPRDQASVNAMKQTCVIVIILAYLPYSNPICTINAVKALNCPFSYTRFLLKWRQQCTFERNNVVTMS